MDAIKTFDIELDVDNCEKLYDYGHSRYHYRPAKGQWDFSIFADRQQHTNVSNEDENTMVRVDKMDKMFSRSRFMEKKQEKGKEKDAENVPKWNNFDFMYPTQKLPKRVLPVFKPGDIVKGRVILELSEPLQAERLKIRLQGQAMTMIRIYHQHGYYDAKGKDVYVQEEKLAWQKTEQDKDDMGDKFALLALSTNDEPLKSKILPAGSHKFKFEFALPSECRGSTPNLVPVKWFDYACVSYRIKAKIDSGKRFTKDPVTYKGFWLDQKMDIASDVDAMSPFTLDESLDTGIALWKGGRVSCTAKLPRRAYIRGEEIPLTVEIDNQASGDISGVVAQVRLGGKHRTGTKKMSFSRSIDLKGKKVEEPGIPGSQSRVIQMKLPLDFSESAIDSNLIPVGTLSDCPIIDVKYDVNITVKRPGMRKNMEMNIPITVGNVNSKATAASDGLYSQLL